MTIGSSSVTAAWLPRASTVAPRVDGIFAVLLVFSVVLVVGLVAANLYFLIRYREQSDAPRPKLKISTAKLETGWIAATTVVFVGFFFLGARVYLDEERPSAAALQIQVTGRQWMWDVRHPNGRREFDELHVPAGQEVRLAMTSEDVIHSFFVPAFRLKQDVVPGKPVTLSFNATQPGRYHLFCAEFCGTKHSGMTGEVVVMAPEEYLRWLNSGNVVDDLAMRGRALFVKYNCCGCHDQPAAVHAPPLGQLAGGIVPLRDNRFVTADDAYLRDSILQPAKDVVAGYDPIMPSYQGVIPDADLLDLIAYLKSLPGRSGTSASTPRVP
jgi:cytochrome c oxidase subunit 2